MIARYRHGFFFGFAVMLIAAIFSLSLAGCGDKDSGDPASPGGGYTVSYNAGTGGGTPPANQTVSAGTNITLPGQGQMTAPSGQSFNGWQSGGQNYQAGDSYTVNASTTFVAQWSTGGGGGGGEDETAPSAPTSVTATAVSSSSISVSWSSVSGATSYDVYYEIGSSSTKNFAGNISGASYTHSGLQASTTYSYYIKAKNSVGESDYSAYSSSASATTSSGGGGGGTSKPNAPTGVKATAASSSIQITWNSVSGAAKYRLYAAMTSYGTGLDVGNYFEEVTGTSYNDTYPEAGETWYYKVSAVNSAGEGPQSAVVSAKITSSGGGGGGTTNTPNAPYGSPVIKNKTSTGWTVEWNASLNATGYKLYRKSSLSSSWGLAYSGSSTSFTETGLTSGVTYYYRVSATNTAGESGYSDERSMMF